VRGEPEPNELLQDSREAYFAAHPAHGGGAVYLSLFAALVFAAALLPIIRLDVTTRARGFLRPSIEQHRVVAGVAGVVERVDARLGARVRAGDLLLALRRDAIQARLTALDSAAALADARASELQALIGLAATLEGGDGSPRAPRSASPAGRASVPGGRFPEESARLRAEWLDLSREIAPARQDAARARQLAARGLASPAELEGAALRLERARSAPRLLLARQRDAWTADLEEARARMHEIAAERASRLAEAGLHDVRAPVEGTVEAVGALSPGSWVAAGQEIAVVSPEAPLLAEVFLDSREVGRVRGGMPVRLLVDAFDHHEWGTLPAEVVEVGQDYTVVGGRPLFRVHCRPLRKWLRRPDGAVARPGKGMAVTAAFTLGRRTLLHLLWDRTAGAERDDAGPDATPSS